MKDGIIFTILLIVWTVIKLVFKLIWVIVKVLAALIVFFGLYIPLFYAVFGIVLLATTDFTLGVAGTNQILYYIGLGLCGLASIFISIRNLIVRPISAIFAPFLEYRDDVKKARDDLRKEDGKGVPEGNPYPDPRGNDPYYGQGGYDPYGRTQYPPQYPYPPRQPYDGRPDYSREQPYGEMPPPADAAPGYYGGAERTPYQPYYGGRAPEDSSRREYPPQVYPPEQNRGFAPAPERPLIYYSKRRPGILVKEYSDRFELFDESDGTRRYIGTEYKDE